MQTPKVGCGEEGNARLRFGQLCLLALLLAQLCGGAATVQAQASSSSPHTIVGAIRWDGWWLGSWYIPTLNPQRYHHRLPFYGIALSDNQVFIQEDTQEVIDQEIEQAHAGGLDFWAIDYYDPRAWPAAELFDYGLKYYRASAHKAELNYCLICFPQGNFMGPPDKWAETAVGFVEMFKEPTYQKVLGNRSLLFLYGLDKMTTTFGSQAAARAAMDLLRTDCTNAGLGPAYIVAQVWSKADGVTYVKQFGLDAISAYSISPGGSEVELPYGDLVESNCKFWNQCKDAGKKVIPIVNTGWDNRPLRNSGFYTPPPYGPWFTEPTATELEKIVRTAIQWNKTYPSAAEANAVLMYAWNETAEGGWLHPTRARGAERLDAVARAGGASPIRT